jgi:tRNA(Ile)-lysidine synthase
MNPLTPGEFAGLMAGLGPLGDAPRLAIAVSGGPDSLALAVLATAWARTAGGEAVALILDHGLRPEAAAEAEATGACLAGLGIRPRVLRLRGLRPGSGLPARARAARFAMLEAASAELGAVALLLGHHAADQAETLLLRVLDGSGAAGLSGMAVRRETARVVLLRPLLGVPPGRLRATLAAAGLRWILDPSNADPTFARSRLRRWRADADGEGVATAALAEAARSAGRLRATAERERAAILARRVSVHPEGYARLAPGPIEPDALRVLLKALSGAGFAPAEARVAALAICPRAATLGGVRILPAGRLGPGWLLVREARAMAPSVAAIPGTRWDGRFRLAASARPPAGARLGALGAAAARFGPHSTLPAAVLVTLPALRSGEEVVAVPHLGYPDAVSCALVPVLFSPNEPVGGAPFAIVGRAGDA